MTDVKYDTTVCHKFTAALDDYIVALERVFSKYPAMTSEDATILARHLMLITTLTSLDDTLSEIDKNTHNINYAIRN